MAICAEADFFSRNVPLSNDQVVYLRRLGRIVFRIRSSRGPAMYGVAFSHETMGFLFDIDSIYQDDGLFFRIWYGELETWGRAAFLRSMGNMR